MVSEKLASRVLFETTAGRTLRKLQEQEEQFRRNYRRRESTKANAKAEAIIDRLVRRLVLFMVCAEKDGAMSRDRIEACVLKAFENAEFLYYGLTSDELLTLIEMEWRNEKVRKRNI